MALIVGTNSYVTRDEANDYIEGSYTMAARWSTMSDAEKDAALITAYRHLQASEHYSVAAAASGAQQEAQCEQAMFVVREGAALEQRAGIRAQGVTSAGVIKETYDPGADALPLSAAVKAILVSVKRDLNAPVTGMLYRDEEPDDDIIQDTLDAR